MSSWTDSKTASQFVSLLKGKLHPQRIRRSEQIKHTSTTTKPPDQSLNSQQHKSGCLLAEQQRAVLSSLQYFKALVDRLGVDKMVLDQSVVGGLLGGASSSILEAVQTLVQLKPHCDHSQTGSACLTRLYLSVAQLVRWADQVMLRGVAHDDKESSESVTTVIRAVLDGVKELVRLAAEKQEGSAPLPLVQSECVVGRPGGSDRRPGAPAEEEEEGEGEGEEVKTERREDYQTVLAPPKPPVPFTELRPQVSPSPGLNPPALPPKKRHPSGPTPCRVAIVPPMRREPEVDRQVQQEDDCLKDCYSSENTHCEEDPDYDFLHTDLSSSDSLPPLPHPSSLPPALPEKRRHSATGGTSYVASRSFGLDSAPPEDSPSHCDDESLSCPLSPSKTPPPLPEKRRHIHQYLQLCSAYSTQSAAMFYQRPLTSKQREDMQTSDSTPSQLLPGPGLPPKKRHPFPVYSSQSLQQEEEEEEKEEEEEVLLTDQQEILSRIIMKAEEEEGPDIKAASPDILLVVATETDSISEQQLFRDVFLSTYRTFLSPGDVVCRLRLRYRHLRDGRSRAASGTFHLLVSVVDELCAIELDSDLLLLLMDLVFSLLIGGELGPALMLRSNILSKMEQRWQLIGSPQSLRPLAARGVAARPGTLLDFRSQDLAEQLTLLDSELFYKIQLPEVLLWSKEQNEEKSPNLTQFTQHFNNVSFWVRSVVILQDKQQDRDKLLLKFLKTMKHLRKLNNFNSYLSILSALDSAPLRRLDWPRSSAEALEEFSSLIDSSSSFRAYRAALSEVEPPCIPYLGLILQDLTFVHLGNPDLVTSQGSKVNFSKRWQQFNILDTLRSYQQVRYSLQPNDDIISFFNDFSDHLAEEALWELSLRLRPRNVPRAIQR